MSKKEDIIKQQKDLLKKQQEKASQPSGEKYTVKAGDTLSAIALEFYGNAGEYMTIYEANKDVIGDDPDRIQAGMELIIPEKE